MRLKFLLFLFLAFAQMCAYSETADTSAQAPSTDTVQYSLLDSALIDSIISSVAPSSPLLFKQKPLESNVQQYREQKRNGYVFLLLLLMLGVITYVKVSFGKEMEDLIMSMRNQNFALQIFRTQSGEISFSSFLLHVNFVVTSSLYLRFILVKFFHATQLEKFNVILFLIFLFTFFYVLKIVVMQLIGFVFEMKDECREYVFHFTTICKIIGLTLIPALFIFYTAPEKIFLFIFLITIFICALLLLLFVWRGLSTAYKLLYRSVYHFFIYVCIVEISMMFLFLKLLTKTII